eukprot:7914223-Alexandrium_andersonii.AAC.1
MAGPCRLGGHDTHQADGDPELRWWAEGCAGQGGRGAPGLPDRARWRFAAGMAGRGAGRFQALLGHVIAPPVG